MRNYFGVLAQGVVTRQHPSHLTRVGKRDSCVSLTLATPGKGSLIVRYLASFQGRHDRKLDWHRPRHLIENTYHILLDWEIEVIWR